MTERTGLHADELEAQDIVVLPVREALSLLSTPLLGTDPTALTGMGGTSGSTGQLGGQTATNASQLANGAAADAATAQAAGAQTYQPSLTSFAQS